MILMMQKHTCLLSVCSVLTSLTRDTPSHYSKLLLALCAGRRSVALVDFVPDAGAEGLIAVSGQQSPRSSQQAKVVVESVALLNPILKEETVTQSVIAYSVFHLRQMKILKKIKNQMIFRYLSSRQQRNIKTALYPIHGNLPFQGRGSLYQMEICRKAW